MVDRLEVTRQQWDTWIKALTKGEDSVVARLNRAARAMSKTADEQTESKWGTEDGPSSFGSRYKKYLSEEAKALTQMAANAEKFAEKIEDALKKITGNDDESRASLDKVRVKGQNVCLARRVAGVRFGLFECRLSGCSRCR